MSVYKPRGSKLYVFDFWRGGRRFHGPTGCASKREAQEVETAEIAKAEAKVDASKVAEAELKGETPLTLDIAAGKWWQETGQHRSDSKDCWRAVEAMIEHFGKDQRLDRVTDRDVAGWVAQRRGEHVKGIKERGLVSPATVNRTTVDCLRTIYGHARRKWKVAFANEPDWGAHRLKEPEERVRELEPHEQDAITLAARPEYERIYRFARLTGLRLTACLIKKEDVKWKLGRIEVKSKGGKLNRVPLSDEVRAVLAECWNDHPEYVFSYVVKRTRGGRVRNERRPITREGLKTAWRRDRERAIEIAPSLATYRFHDNRHTAATRILRTSHNLKVAQKLLNHARITTTAKYAHVLDDEVLDAMNATPDGAKKSQGGSQGGQSEVA